MRVGRLTIHNFRGISQLDWSPAGAMLCCFIGHGDSTKSTVLDAIEAALSSRWFTFTETDFYLCDTKNSIVIEVTIGELSKSLLSDERFGLYIRGWGASGFHDEPEDGDEPVLTIRLSVDATMEPVWEVVNDRANHPRTISNRDRALFGVVRLSGDDARHLTWGQGSVLSKLTEDSDEAAKHLADAYRVAKESANLGSITELADASAEAEQRAKNIGAYVTGVYGPGLELGRGGFSSGSIALHDGAVPLRLAGMGTRRLATLAIQRAAIGDGAIILVDEIEQGLEPHRILGAIVHLKAAQAEALAQGRSVGQVLMTTHSDVALTEIAPASLHVVRAYSSLGVQILKPTESSDFHRVLKKSPRALFARRVLVCEGETELGLMLGLREVYPARHGGIPIEQRGVAIVDGNGAEAPFLAAGFGALGYQTALYRDSDVPLEASQAKLLADNAVEVFTYASPINTEQALFRAVKNAEDMDFFLQVARDVKGRDTIHDQLQKALPELTGLDFADHFQNWNQFGEISGDELIERLATLARSMSWFKNRHVARSLALRVDTIVRQNPLNNLSDLAAESAHALVERYRFGAQASIHAPDAKDGMNWHVHILATTRRLGMDGLADKTRELDGGPSGKAEVEWIREMVARLTNAHLAAAQVDAVVDHRSLKAQAEAAVRSGDLASALVLSREPSRHVGKNASALHRRGMACEQAEANERVSEANEERFQALLARFEGEGRAMPVSAGHGQAQARQERRAAAQAVDLSPSHGAGQMRGVRGFRGLHIDRLHVPPRPAAPSTQALFEEAVRLWLDDSLTAVVHLLKTTRQLLEDHVERLAACADVARLRTDLRELIKRLKAVRSWALAWKRRLGTEDRALGLLHRAERSLEEFTEAHPHPGEWSVQEWAKRRGRRFAVLERRLSALKAAREALAPAAQEACEAKLEAAIDQAEQWSRQMLERYPVAGDALAPPFGPIEWAPGPKRAPAAPKPPRLH